MTKAENGLPLHSLFGPYRASRFFASWQKASAPHRYQEGLRLR